MQVKHRLMMMIITTKYISDHHSPLISTTAHFIITDNANLRSTHSLFPLGHCNSHRRGKYQEIIPTFSVSIQLSTIARLLTRYSPVSQNRSKFKLWFSSVLYKSLKFSRILFYSVCSVFDFAVETGGSVKRKEMFGFSRRRMKLERIKKVQLSDAAQGTRSPVRHNKRLNISNGESMADNANDYDELIRQSSSDGSELSNCASGSSENWMVLSVSGVKPEARFNHAAAVVGNNMVVVGGESSDGLLDDVQVLSFDRFSWTRASPKRYHSPTSHPLKIPPCKGHTLVPWGKKVLLIGGKTEPASERVTVWAFDMDEECWSLMEAKGDTPVARSGHTVVRANSVLILFGGEDSKRRKLNDMHMFDLKSLTWLPLHCTGPRPSPRSNHVAALCDDKILLVFGGASKSRTLNDLYSLDFETMVWSRVKTRGFHPSPRAGGCGALCGTKWYIIGGGSKKKPDAETLIFDVLKLEWSVAVASPSSSITTNKGFSLVLVQHRDRDFLVAFGGFKKDPSDQVEVLVMEKIESSIIQKSTLFKVAGMLSENRSLSVELSSQPNNVSLSGHYDSVSKLNLVSASEQHGSGRKSLSESLLGDTNSALGNVSLRKQSNNQEENAEMTIMNVLEDKNQPQLREQNIKPIDLGAGISSGGDKIAEETCASESDNLSFHDKQGGGSLPLESDGLVFPENDGKSRIIGQSNIYQAYEAKLAALLRKNGILEGQLTVALAGREAAEKNLLSSLKIRQETEKKLADIMKELEFFKEKLNSVELAHEEANSLSNIVHSDNVRLEHDVAFLKAVLDDTQKELHSTRGILAGERARAFQLQVEVFHLKQRLQSMETRAPTPRKPFHV